MNISVDKLLRKIEEELKLAKSSTGQENLREKVYSIKILCELILDDKQGQQEAPATPVTAYQPLTAYQPVTVQPTFSQPVSLNQPKKLGMEDEANGDSLFDF